MLCCVIFCFEFFFFYMKKNLLISSLWWWFGIYKCWQKECFPKSWWKPSKTGQLWKLSQIVWQFTLLKWVTLLLFLTQLMPLNLVTLFFFIPPKGLSAYITLLPEIDLLSLVNVSLSAYFIWPPQIYLISLLQIAATVRMYCPC